MFITVTTGYLCTTHVGSLENFDRNKAKEKIVFLTKIMELCSSVLEVM